MAKGVEVAAIRITKEQALDAQYLLARDTPVDTAEARSNWRISIGRPLSGVIAPYKPYLSRWSPPYGPGGSKGESTNLSQVTAQGKARLSRYKTGSIYISNNVPYIGPLDRGHSKQTSGGFVARAVDNAIGRTRPKIKAIFNEELSK